MVIIESSHTNSSNALRYSHLCYIVFLKSLLTNAVQSLGQHKRTSKETIVESIVANGLELGREVDKAYRSFCKRTGWNCFNVGICHIYSPKTGHLADVIPVGSIHLAGKTQILHLRQSVDMRQSLHTKCAWSRKIDCHILAFYAFNADIADRENLAIAVICVSVMTLSELQHMLAFIEHKKIGCCCFGFICVVIIHFVHTIHGYYTIVVAGIRIEGGIVGYCSTSLSLKLNCDGGT